MPNEPIAQITGETRLYVILGDPVAQVRAPQGFNPVLRARGVNGVLVPMHVAPADLAGVVAALRTVRNFGGLITTVPHKVAMLDLVDEVRPNGRRIGAINTVVNRDGRWIGDMFDGAGFVTGLKLEGHDPAGRSVLLLGAGGAGSAMAFALADAGVAGLAIFDLDQAKAEGLVAALGTSHPGLRARFGTADPAGFGLVVHATTLGMKPDDPLALDPDRLSPGTLVAEAVMKPEKTRLLVEAEARGCRIHLGRHMMDGQTEEWVRFFGV